MSQTWERVVNLGYGAESGPQIEKVAQDGPSIFYKTFYIFWQPGSCQNIQILFGTHFMRIKLQKKA